MRTPFLCAAYKMVDLSPSVGKEPGREPGSAARGIANRILAMAMDELGRDETQKRIRDRIVDPLVKMMHAQLWPYLLMLMAIVTAILIMTMTTLALSAMFYFGAFRKNSFKYTGGS